LFVSDHVGATMSVRANTTAFGVYVVMTTESGKLGWSIDGGPETEKNMTHQYVHTNDWWIQNVMFTNDLPTGEHTLKLTVRPKSEKSGGNFVHVAGFCVTNPRPAK
jgi:hypothetical protein